MNEDLQRQIASTIKEFADSIGTAKDFAVEQAPDIIQQLLLWGMVGNAAWMIICSVTIWLSYLWVFEWSDQKKEKGEPSASKIFSSVAGGIASFCAAVVFVVSMMTFLKIIIAPKVYLLSVAAGLVK